MSFVFNWKQQPMYYAQNEDAGRVGDPQAVWSAQNSQNMAGYRPASAGIAPNAPSMQHGGYAPQSYEGYGDTLQTASNTARDQMIADIDAQIVANNAKIAELKSQLGKAMMSNPYADDLDRQLAANRVKANDYANAQTHLGRIESRLLAARQQEAMQRLQDQKNQSSDVYYNDLLDLARAKADAAALKDDPNLSAEAAAIYNIKLEQFRKKHGEPDFARYAGKATPENNSDYVSGESLGTAKEFSNFVENRTGKYKGKDVWKGTEEERKKAAQAARNQYNEAEAKRIEDMPTSKKVDEDIAEHERKVKDLTKKVDDAMADLANMSGTPADIRAAYDKLPKDVKKNIDMKASKGGKIEFTKKTKIEL